MRRLLTTFLAAAALWAATPARAEVALGYIVRIDLKGEEAESPRTRVFYPPCTSTTCRGFHAWYWRYIFGMF